MRGKSRNAPGFRPESASQKSSWSVLGWPSNDATVISEGGIITQVYASEDYECLAFWLFKPVVDLELWITNNNLSSENNYLYLLDVSWRS